MNYSKKKVRRQRTVPELRPSLLSSFNSLLLIPSDAGLLNPNNSKFTRSVLANHWDIYANDNNSDQIRSLHTVLLLLKQNAI